MSENSKVMLKRALPGDRQALIDQRKTRPNLTLNDHVEAIHLRLYDDLDYRKFVDAVWDDDAEEGSLSADNLEAAHMIRECARLNDIPEVSRKKKATISKALNVVFRRLNMVRKERRYTIGGEIMSAPDNDVG